MICKSKHISNAKTAAVLDEEGVSNKKLSFDSPFHLFKYLGLPTIGLNKNFQKIVKRRSKKRNYTIPQN